MEEVTNYIDRGYPVDIIYLDFQKAFDKVPNRRLLMKLNAHETDIWPHSQKTENSELYSMAVSQSGGM